MRVPPYSRDPGWQRFFAGAAIGTIISWIVFTQIFGILQEKQVRQLKTQQEIIAQLKHDLNIWQQDYIQLNKENKKRLTIQSIDVKIINAQSYGIDTYTTFRIEEDIKRDIQHITAKDIETVYKSKELLKKAIENKTYIIDNRTYHLDIETILFFTNISIELKLKQQ
ncbi:sporulation membrane protein YtrI [Anoxybacillus sp. TBDG-1]